MALCCYRTIHLTVLKASGIPSRKIYRSSKFSVVVSMDERIWKTKECQRNDPEWNETFVLNVQDSAVLHVAVIDRVGTGRSSLRGEMSIAIKDIGYVAVVEKAFQLQKEGRPRGEITLTLERVPLRAATAAERRAVAEELEKEGEKLLKQGDYDGALRYAQHALRV
ncbi:hypothetical protein BV22DRAFT_1132352 [Leucogyrophana mollusca]|uniref:Uncharacterized protein n=1 Tax=Leucogyrophana mollusca TaxID=85980 RepID=A0ACB8B8U8_9AGAM|nr:hypothetical protein BV22DRAFT_1132352 [Leucogyrophana mollusca]